MFSTRVLTVVAPLLTVLATPFAHAASPLLLKRLSAEIATQLDGSTRLTNIRFLRGDMMYPVKFPSYGAYAKNTAESICKYLDKGTLLDTATVDKTAVVADITFDSAGDVQYKTNGDATTAQDIYYWIDCEKNNAVKKVIADKKTQLDGTIRLSNLMYLRGALKLPIKQNTDTDTANTIATAICTQFGLGRVVEKSYRSMGKAGEYLSITTDLKLEQTYADRTGDVLDWIDCDDV